MSLAEKSTSILKRDVLVYSAKLLTSVIIARKLGPDMLGVFIILSLIPSYAESFGRVKFDVAAVYLLGKQRYLIGEVLLTLNLLALASSGLIVAVIVWQFDWIYSVLFSKTKYDAITLAHFILLQIPLHFLWMNYSYMILHKEDTVSYNRMILINALVSSILSISLLILLDLGLWAVAFSAVVGTLLSLIYGIIAVGVIGPTGKVFNRTLILDLFKYGAKLYAGGLIGHFQAYITNLLTVLYLAPSQVSFFAIARGYGQMIDRVPSALNTILFPQLSKTVDPKEAADVSARAFRMLLVLLIIVAVIAALLIYPAVSLMYGSEYLPLVVPFLILLPGIVISGATTPFMSYFMSINHPGLTVTMPILPLAIQVALALLIIPMWGPAGAALAFAVGLVLHSLISCWTFLKLSGFNLRRDLMVRQEDISYLWHFSATMAGKIWMTTKSMRT